MIGNNMYDDIAGASRVGMESFYIHSALSPREQEDSTSQDIRADYVMRRMNLRQLQNRLLP